MRLNSKPRLQRSLSEDALYGNDKRGDKLPEELQRRGPVEEDATGQGGTGCGGLEFGVHVNQYAARSLALAGMAGHGMTWVLRKRMEQGKPNTGRIRCP